MQADKYLKKFKFLKEKYKGPNLGGNEPMLGTGW